jgi:hypothetical protein
MTISTEKSRRISAISIAAASMLLAAPGAQARLDEGGAPNAPEPFVQGVTDFPSTGVRNIQVAERPGGGADWGDAGIGAGVALGAALAALGARHTVRAVKSGA